MKEYKTVGRSEMTTLNWGVIDCLIHHGEVGWRKHRLIFRYASAGPRKRPSVL